MYLNKLRLMCIVGLVLSFSAIANAQCQGQGCHDTGTCYQCWMYDNHYCSTSGQCPSSCGEGRCSDGGGGGIELMASSKPACDPTLDFSCVDQQTVNRERPVFALTPRLLPKTMLAAMRPQPASCQPADMPKNQLFSL